MSDLVRKLINALISLDAISGNNDNIAGNVKIENEEDAINDNKTLEEIFEVYKMLKNELGEDNVHFYALLIYFRLEDIKSEIQLNMNISNITSRILNSTEIYIADAAADIRTIISTANTEADLNQSNSNRKGKLKRTNYSKGVSKTLKTWLRDHIRNPYPTEAEKIELCRITGLDHTQINNWFINARRRILPLMKKNSDYE